MGNSLAADVNPSHSENRKVLDLSNRLNHKEFCQHLEYQCSSQCLSEIPSHVLDSTWMYEKLLASCNCLSSLPPELPLRVPHLTHLNLDYNHLTTLPNSFGLFIHLHVLLVKHNNIEQLPPSFVHLPRLYKLDISHNKLKELPSDIGSMTRLSKLNVSHNKLTELPLSLGRSSRLTVLLAQGNLCQNPPQDLCDNESSDKLIAYLQKMCPSKGVANSNGLSASVQCNVFPRIRCNDAISSLINPHSPKSKYVQVQTQTTHTASRIKTPLLVPFGTTSFSLYELGDKITGLLYGAVIGDALGLGTEFMSPDECSFHYDPINLNYEDIIQDEHTAHWRRGEWTSNSDQLFLVLDSVLHWAGMVDELDFAQRLLQWKNHGFPDLNESEEYMLSETINEVLKKKCYLDDPHTAAQSLLQQSQINGINICNGSDRNHQDSGQHTDSIMFCDNGALPRAVLLGIIQFDNIKEVITNSVRICLATHADERCVAACVALSVLVALLLQGKYSNRLKSEIDEILIMVRNAAVQYLKNEEHAIEFDRYLYVEDYASIQLHEKEKFHFTFKPLAAAVLALRSQQSIRTTLTDVILQGGHGSMNGCIAGAVLGCAIGFSHLPKVWVEGLLPGNVQWLNGRINSLLDKMGLP